MNQDFNIINNTLKTIEKTILFTITNYFREFSKEYKKFHKLEYIDNDWYVYVEFGTDNQVTIVLQRNGYVRENAKWINEHSFKFNLIDRSQGCKFAPFLLDYDALINCGEKKLKKKLKLLSSMFQSCSNKTYFISILSNSFIVILRALQICSNESKVKFCLPFSTLDMYVGSKLHFSANSF